MPPFKKGQSGNPKGRSKNSPDWRSKLRKQIEVAAPDLIERLLVQAEGGDASAIKWILDKVLPNIKPESAPATIKIEANDEAGSILSIIQSMAKGEVALESGQEIIAALTKLVQVKESSEVLKRIEALEKRIGE